MFSVSQHPQLEDIVQEEKFTISLEFAFVVVFPNDTGVEKHCCFFFKKATCSRKAVLMFLIDNRAPVSYLVTAQNLSIKQEPSLSYSKKPI